MGLGCICVHYVGGKIFLPESEEGQTVDLKEGLHDIGVTGAW